MKNHVLIIDKNSEIAEELISNFSQDLDSNVVLLAQKSTQYLSKRTFFIPFNRKIPNIPDIVYTHIFAVINSDKESKRLLEHVQQKAKRDGVVLIVIVPVSIYSLSFAQKLYQTYPCRI